MALKFPGDATGAGGLGPTLGGVRPKRPLKSPNGGPDLLNDFPFLQNSDFVISFV